MLEALLDMFWARGYSNASLDDLAGAAGVKRASLYVAFGDKETMYVRALERFAGQLTTAFQACTANGSQADGLNAFYQASLDHYLSSDPPRGCLVLCTAPVEAPASPAIRAALCDVLTNIDAAFAAVFRKADPQLSDDQVRFAAQMASAFLHSLALRARSGEDEAGLRAFAQKAANLLARDTTIAARV